MSIARNMHGVGIQPSAATAIIGTLRDGVSAAGNNQANAYLISDDRTIFSVVPSGSGARLPKGNDNDNYQIHNDTATSLLLYPPFGGTINGGSIDAPMTVQGGAAVTVFYQDYLTIRVDTFAFNPSGFVKRDELAANGGAAMVGNAPAGNISATTVQGALNELDTEKVSLVQLAASDGSTLVGNGSETVADSFNALQLADYTALRAYAGPRKSVYVTGTGVAGLFVLRSDLTPATATDNGGTRIVGVHVWDRDYSGAVNVKWFGAKGDGTTDDTAAIQSAINCAASGATPLRVFFPGGVYLHSLPLQIPAVGGKGIVLEGDLARGVYLKTPAGSTFDMLRVAASYVRVSGLMFRPGGTQPCIRLYAADCEVSGNQFLAATNNAGSAILLADTDPDTGTSVSGAYTHIIDNNIIGVSGFAFAHAIEDASANGIQACKITRNHVTSNGPFKMSKGGANLYSGNLLQSSTGTNAAPVGNGIDIGANVTAEKIFGGNYFEGFANGVLIRTTDTTYQAAYVVGNHFDNCTARVTSLVSNNYLFEDAIAGTLWRNGWTDKYSSTATREFHGVTGGTPILTLDETNKAIKVNKEYTPLVQLNFSANGETQTPTQKTMIISGNGAGRTGCILGIANVQDGQELTLLGLTWPVTLINTNVRFASNAASATFGNTTGNVQAMRLIYRAANSTWYEVSRTTY